MLDGKEVNQKLHKKVRTTEILPSIKNFVGATGHCPTGKTFYPNFACDDLNEEIDILCRETKRTG
jgi:hypothetical protein